MSGLAAARMGDEIAHGMGLLAVVAGAVVGSVVGSAIIGATVATGGAAVAIMAGSIVAGGFSFGLLFNALNQLFNLPEPTTGVLARGSPDVLINGMPAIRAGLDMAAACSGFPFNHFPMPMPLVAEGSKTVFINGMPAGRLKDQLICGAHIKSGSPNVIIGGETQQVLPISDLESLVLESISEISGAVYGALAGAIMTLPSIDTKMLSDWASLAQSATSPLEALIEGIIKFKGANAIASTNAKNFPAQMERIKAIMKSWRLSDAANVIKGKTAKSALAMAEYATKYKGLLQKIPWLGRVLTFAEESDRLVRADNNGEGFKVIVAAGVNFAGDAGATSAGAWAGAQGGALVGAGIGSVIPVVGTAAGAMVGGVVGAVIGAFTLHGVYDSYAASEVREAIAGEKFRDEN